MLTGTYAEMALLSLRQKTLARMRRDPAGAQGQFKRRICMDDVITGQEFSRATNLPAQWLVDQVRGGAVPPPSPPLPAPDMLTKLQSRAPCHCHRHCRPAAVAGLFHTSFIIGIADITKHEPGAAFTLDM